MDTQLNIIIALLGLRLAFDVWKWAQPTVSHKTTRAKQRWQRRRAAKKAG